MSSHFSLQLEKAISNESQPQQANVNKPSILKDKRGSVHLRLFKLMLGRSLLNVLQDDKCTKLFNMQIQKENYMRKIVNKKIVSLKVEEDQDMVLTIVKKSYKNKFEQQFLINAIKDLDFFERNTFLLEQQHKLSNIINQKTVQKGTTLLEIGDVCSCYFILVKGLVYGMHPKLKAIKWKQNKKNSNIFSSQQNGLQKQGTHEVDAQFIPLSGIQENQQMNHIISNPNTPKHSPKAKLLMRQQSKSVFNENPLTIPQMYPHMDILHTYKPGDSFGQVFLLSNSTSEMTFICGEDCEFLTISKQDYEQLVGIQREQILRQKLEFLEKFDIFYNFTNIMLLNILELMQILKLEKNQVIFKQGEECKYIYFIRQGEVKISFTYSPQSNDAADNKINQIQLNKKQNGDSQLNSLLESKREKQKNTKKRLSSSQMDDDLSLSQNDQNQSKQKAFDKNYMENDQEILKNLEQQSKQVKNSLLTQYNTNFGRKITKKLDIIILSSNTYFGEEDIISHQQYRNFTATCQSSQTEIFKIDAQRLIKILKIQHTYQKMIQTQKTKTSWYVQRRNELIQFCQNLVSEKTNENSNIQDNQTILKTLKNNFSEKDIMSFSKNIQLRRGSGINNHLTLSSIPSLQNIQAPYGGASLNSFSNNSPSLNGFEEKRLKMNHQLFQDKLFTKDFQIESNKDFIPSSSSKSSVSFNFLDTLQMSQDKPNKFNRNLKNFLSPQQKDQKQIVFSFTQKSQQKIDVKTDKNLQSIQEQPSFDLQKILNTQIFSLQNISKIDEAQITSRDEDVCESKQKRIKKSSLKLQIKEKINEQSNKSTFNELLNLKEISPHKQHQHSKSLYSTMSHSPESKLLLDGLKFEKDLKELITPQSKLAKESTQKDNFIFSAINKRKNSNSFLVYSQPFSLKSSRIISPSDDSKIIQEENQTCLDNNLQSVYQPSTLQNLELTIPPLKQNRTYSLNPTTITSYSQSKSAQVSFNQDKAEQSQQNLKIKQYFLPEKNKSYNMTQSLNKLNLSSSRPKIYLNNSSKSIDAIQLENKTPQSKVNYVIQSSQNSRKNSYLNLNQDEQTLNKDQVQIPMRLADFDHIQSRNAQILQQYNKEKFGQRITSIFKLNKCLINSNKEKVLNFLINKGNQQVQ